MAKGGGDSDARAATEAGHNAQFTNYRGLSAPRGETLLLVPQGPTHQALQGEDRPFGNYLLLGLQVAGAGRGE